MSAVFQSPQFDVDAIHWQPFGSYTGFDYRLLNVDVDNRVIDMLFRFEPDRRCFYHTHHTPSSTLVLHGEQHIWEKDENGDERHKVRRAGEFAVSNGADTHIEGGGPDGAVIYMNVRANDDIVYSILNDDLTTRVDVSLGAFAEAFAAQS
ncbi:MAG: cupin domain-containing protein [Gammaproteobacteria bacterium]